MVNGRLYCAVATSRGAGSAWCDSTLSETSITICGDVRRRELLLRLERQQSLHRRLRR